MPLKVESILLRLLFQIIILNKCFIFLYYCTFRLKIFYFIKMHKLHLELQYFKKTHFHNDVES